MIVVYGVLCLAALGLVGVCLAVDRTRDIYLLLMSVSIFLCELGYLLIAVARTLPAALNANRLAYLGQVFLPLLLLMMILNLCRVRYPTFLPPALFLLGVVVLGVVCSPGIFPWYYRSVSIRVADGVTTLLREYGPLHGCYSVYLFAYLAADTAVILHTVRKRRLHSARHAPLLLAAVYCHVIIWLVEKFLPRGFEYLSVSYVMTELFLLLVYGMLQDYGLLGRDEEALVPTAKPGAAPAEDGSLFAFSQARIDRIMVNCAAVAALTPREQEVLQRLLADKRRKDIADELYLSESSIKKYTASIFRKLEVESRKELLTKLRDYL